jgi:small-conductance mechanosensitive channel
LRLRERTFTHPENWDESGNDKIAMIVKNTCKFCGFKAPFETMIKTCYKRGQKSDQQPTRSSMGSGERSSAYGARATGREPTMG